MTERQLQIWDLYASGHGPTAIARALGLKSRSTVTISLAQKAGLLEDKL